MKIGANLNVRRKQWRHPDGKTEALIVVHMGASFVLIPFDRARQLVDVVHDLCDDHERSQQPH